MRKWFSNFMLGFTCVFRNDPIKFGIATSRGILFTMKCLVAGLLFGVALLWITGCAGDGKREAWQDCAGVSHEECWDLDEYLDCEYEFYKVCISE